jgi:hypothetical protein
VCCLGKQASCRSCFQTITGIQTLNLVNINFGDVAVKSSHQLTGIAKFRSNVCSTPVTTLTYSVFPSNLEQKILFCPIFWNRFLKICSNEQALEQNCCCEPTVAFCRQITQTIRQKMLIKLEKGFECPFVGNTNHRDLEAGHDKNTALICTLCRHNRLRERATKVAMTKCEPFHSSKLPLQSQVTGSKGQFSWWKRSNS